MIVFSFEGHVIIVFLEQNQGTINAARLQNRDRGTDRLALISRCKTINKQINRFAHVAILQARHTYHLLLLHSQAEKQRHKNFTRFCWHPETPVPVKKKSHAGL
jgi:hypothetical protein